MAQNKPKMDYGRDRQSTGSSGVFGTRVTPPSPKETLKFLLLPDFKPSISPLRECGQMFVKMLAYVFAQQGLFPRNHPVLTTETRANLQEVFRTAYHNLRWTKAGVPQQIFFWAVIGMLICSGIAVLSLGLSFLIGGAHAQSMFNFAAKDMSCDIIKYLFILTSEFCQGGGVQFFQQQAVRQGILSIFFFYSNAMLVFAAFILLYHLVSMVAETAHQGVFMGRRANQIWAPIRLIVAIGLLVPINGDLSTGQKIVIQIASWGSGMGSQAWAAFMNRTVSSSATIAGSPEVSGLVMGMIRNYACMHMHNSIANSSPNFRGQPRAQVFEDQLNLGRTGEVIFRNKISTERGICGSYQIPQPATNGPGLGFYVHQKETFDAQRQEMERIGREIGLAFSPITGSTEKQDALDKQMISRLIESYEQAAQYENAGVEISGPISQRLQQVNQSARDWGWVAAGAWPLAISTTLQEIINQMSTSLPTVTSPSGFIAGASRELGGRLNAVRARNTIMEQLAAGMGQADLWAKSLGSTPNTTDNATVANTASNAASGWGALDYANPANISRLLFWFMERLLYFKGIWKTGSESYGQVNVDFVRHHPLIEFIGLGQRWLSGSLDILGWGLGLSAAGSTVGSVVIIGVSTMVGAPGVGAFLAAAASALSWLAPVLIAFAFVGIVFSVLVAFYVPMLPFMKFFFNTLTWILGLFEAVLAIPIIAIAHLTVDGEGLPGQLARGAYFQIMGLFLRPILMVAGLIFGLVLFAIGASIVDTLFNAATSVVSGDGGIKSNAFTHIMFTVFYILTLYICANTCFKGIDYIASNALRWINASTWAERMGDSNTMQGQLNNFVGLIALQNLGKGGGAIASISQKIDTNKADSTAAERHRQLMSKP